MPIHNENALRESTADLLLVITARYAALLQQWDELGDDEFHSKLLTLERLTKNILALRRSEQQDARLDLLREKQRDKSASSGTSPASSSMENVSTPKTANRAAAPSPQPAQLNHSSSPGSESESGSPSIFANPAASVLQTQANSNSRPVQPQGAGPRNACNSRINCANAA